MSVPARKNASERGTVLLTTLLIMAVMAAITVALMDDIRVAVKRTINVQAYAQADWQARGAEDFILAYLSTDFRALDPAQQNALVMAKQPITLPTPDGIISVTLKDASHCFNLNSVVDAAGAQNGQARLEFTALAELLGLPTNQAVALSSVLVDWQDKDQQVTVSGAEDGTYLRRDPPFRTADTAMRSPEEMRALHGMDEDLWELFAPFVCTGGAGELTVVNINSLPPSRLLMLSAALGGEDAAPVAQRLLRERPALGYGAPAAITAIVQEAEIDGLNPSRISTTVTSVFVEVVTTVGPAERVRSYRYDGLDSGTPRLTYRGWGRQSFRPEIETTLNTETGTR